MINSSFRRTTQPHVPQDHLPPISNYCLPLCILCGSKVSTLAFSVLYECLDTHRWTILLDILVVRVHFRIGGQLHHVSEQVWIRVQDQFRDEHNHLVFERLFLVCGSVAIIQVDSNVDIERLDNVSMVNVLLTTALEPTKQSDILQNHSIVEEEFSQLLTLP